MFDEWKWNERYPRQHEILSYLNHVADRYDLRRSITFDTTIERAVFDASTSRWEVTTSAGEHVSAQFIVAGVGLLSSTNYPNIVGRDSFAGRSYHTSRWPHEGVDLRTKRVGVIGCGSSGVQLITEIAPQVDELFVFQRRPQYTVPARHSPIPRDALEAINADYEDYWEGVLQSVTAFGFPESPVPAMSVSAEEREPVFEEAWKIGGGFRFMFATFSDIGVDEQANEAAADFIRRKIARIVKDPKLAASLTPWELYARRPLCNDGYYEAYNRDNVNLVDLRDEPIEEITPTGIRTTARDYDLDVIVYATGFDAVTGNYVKIDMRGRDGEQLAREVDRRAALPPRHRHQRVPEHVHDLRTDGSVHQPAARPRVPGELDRRRHRLRARQRPRHDRADARGRGQRGWTSASRSPAARCSRGSTPGSTARTSTAKRSR